MLMGIFAFPIFFQPLHVLRHHAHGHNCACHAHAPQQAYSHKGQHPHLENTAEKEASCAICDYEFSSNDIPNVQCYGTSIPESIYTYNDAIVAQISKRSFTHTTPRAPPTLRS